MLKYIGLKRERMLNMTSPFSKFYNKTREQRLALLLELNLIDKTDYNQLISGLHLPNDIADNMIENQLATYDLPYGLAVNFLIDGVDYAIPMAVEEPSVVAAASNAAKIIKKNGGFTTQTDERLMTGQIAFEKNQLNFDDVKEVVSDHKENILNIANAAHPSMLKRGGGAKDAYVRHVEDDETRNFIVIHLSVDTKEAMGANSINTMLEAVTPYLEDLIGQKSLMSILSNLTTNSLSTAKVSIKPSDLATGDHSGEDIRDQIVLANDFAKADPYRATTHNKGVMNGIDAVVMASGNDWRAIAAGAHAYASRSGKYRSMTEWVVGDNGNLEGSLTLPMPVGTVGGSIKLHPMAKMTHKILGNPDAKTLEGIILSVGLAQNLGAIKALVSDGIQKGHMSLQARTLAVLAGATSDQVENVVEQLLNAEHLNSETAQEIVNNLNKV